MGSILIAINNTDGKLEMKNKISNSNAGELAQVISALEVIKLQMVNKLSDLMGEQDERL